MSCLSAFSKEALSGEARTGIYYDSPLCVFACVCVCVCVCATCFLSSAALT